MIYLSVNRSSFSPGLNVSHVAAVVGKVERPHKADTQHSDQAFVVPETSKFRFNVLDPRLWPSAKGRFTLTDHNLQGQLK